MVSPAARIKAWFTWKKPVANAEANAPGSVGATDSRPVTQAEGSRASASTTPTSQDPAQLTTDGSGSGSAAQTASTNRPPGSRRRRRRRRRSPSPVGLPLYSQEVHDDEMTLAKDTGPVMNARVGLLDLADPDSDDTASLRPSPDLRPASQLSFNRGRPRATSNAASLAPSELSLAATPPRNSVDVPRPGMHRSTVSSPALSPSSPPQLSTTRSRSSTLQSLFTRNRSSTLLSTSPSSSSLRGPYGAGSRFAASSTTSVNSQRISAPLQVVASSFVFPKSGPTGAQISFLSSRESLGMYGISDTSDIAPTYDDNGDANSLEASPPPVSSNTMQVPTRSHRASSVTSQISARSSPLAQQVTTHDGDDPNEDATESLPAPILTYSEAMAQTEDHVPTPVSDFAPSAGSLRPNLFIDSDVGNSGSVHSPVSTPRSQSPANFDAHVEHTPKIGHQRLPSLVLSLPSPLDDSWMSRSIGADESVDRSASPIVSAPSLGPTAAVELS
ncbi:hypothetical protein ACM66B_000213 [Microbotryomycetes sp. NB124-2]